MRRWPTPARRLRVAAGTTLGAVLLAGACRTATGNRTVSTARGADAAAVATSGGPAAATAARGASLRTVRVALATRVSELRISADGAWSLDAADGRGAIAAAQPGEQWALEADGRAVVAIDGSARRLGSREQTVIARPLDASGTITFNGRRWRGELAISAVEGGLLVVNRVKMDDYLKGVVPLEIGTNAAVEMAAIEAQSVAARSYAYMHLAGPSRPYDMVATVADQVYGGVNAENGAGSRAVDVTTGLVLLYGGRVVSAPYSATCGGSTAEPRDAWNTGPEPYLQRVSDQIPGSSRFYCDWAPRYRWTRTFTGEELRQSVLRYLRSVPRGPETVRTVREVTVSEVTPAGRVGTLTIDTDAGRWALRGSQIRSALRSASGEMLYSTYFSVDAVAGRDGIASLTLRGGGNGHGIGMCQTGAIGRARAGQDFRTILRTYYPGTTVGSID